MTYCLGILLPDGLVLASDSRSNAGVDQVARVRKFDLITLQASRVIAILSAGNLATTQSVVTQLRDRGAGDILVFGGGVIPVDDHRVQGGNVPVGEYAAGWIMRGPTGVIGTNRSDAKGAAAAILADREVLLARDTTPGSVFKLLDERGVTAVLMDGWNAIDAAEIAKGSSRNNARIKISVLEDLLAAAAQTGDG